MRHHLSVAVRVRRAPRVSIAHEGPVPGSLPCELRVLETRRVALTGAAARWGSHAHECLLELVTGRTHQIRAQLSAAGCPLLGDCLYAPLADAGFRRAVFEADPAQPLLDPGSGERLLREPEGGIGLQACRLEVDSDLLTSAAPAAFEAGPPWWRA